MSQEIKISSETESGERLEATFDVGRGMNMLSFRKGDIEVIDQSTRALFEERYAGLGAMIGPHFHRRNPGILPKIQDEGKFPHIARIKSQRGDIDPFSHGVARYAPWKSEATENSVTAVLSGEDEWEGVLLSELEGQGFKMTFTATLTPQGLQLRQSVISDTDSLVGLHYYYALPNGKGKVVADVAEMYNDQGVLRPIPPSWDYSGGNTLTFDLDQDADFGFRGNTAPDSAEIVLETENYKLLTRYRACSEESSWQLYHPKGASFVCIEPLSAKEPRKPILSVSWLETELQIL